MTPVAFVSGGSGVREGDEMRTEHWRCSCGAFGHSTSSDANALVKARHDMAGHVVESWERGLRAETLVVSTSTSRRR